jgi:cytoskeletal protein CcmA (bactofilin family)
MQAETATMHGMNRLLAALTLMLGIGTASADDVTRASFGDTDLVAGGDVVLDRPVSGNAFAAGGSVEVRERVEENAYVSGGDVTIAGDVGGNLFAAGGDVRLEGNVDGKVRAAGGGVRFAAGSRIGRDASFAGGSIEVNGEVDGDVRAYGENVWLNGPVGGDLRAAGESIRVGPDARIAGDVVYRSRERIEIDPAAQVGGEIRKSGRGREWLDRAGRGATIAGGITASLGMLLLGAILILGMPRFSREAGATVRHKPWQSIGLGCVMLFAVPFAVIVLMITLVGIPLALLLVFGYLAVLLLGFLVGAIFLGDFALERLDAAKLGSVWWRALFLLIALVAIALVKLVPFVGDLAWWILFLAGLGAFTIRTWQGFRDEPAAPAAATR